MKESQEQEACENTPPSNKVESSPPPLLPTVSSEVPPSVQVNINPLHSCCVLVEYGVLCLCCNHILVTKFMGLVFWNIWIIYLSSKNRLHTKINKTFLGWSERWSYCIDLIIYCMYLLMCIRILHRFIDLERKQLIQ